jgi:hypothetical protein
MSQTVFSVLFFAVVLFFPNQPTNPFCNFIPMHYLHFGVPTTQEKNWSGYLADLGVHVTDPGADLFGIEWLKFDADSPMHESIQTKPHTAFAVDDLDAVLSGKKILLPPYSPAPGFRLAFIDYEGAVIELSETKETK